MYVSNARAPNTGEKPDGRKHINIVETAETAAEVKASLSATSGTAR